MDDDEAGRQTQGGVPAGWYPAEPGTERWWDGTVWTGHVRPTPVGGGVRWKVVGPVLGGVAVLVVALVVTLVLVLGGDDPADAPTDATVDDFCAATEEAYGIIFVLAFQESDVEWETGRAVEVLSETGTPEDIPADARAGFEELVTGLDRVDGMTRSELEELDEFDTNDDPDDDSPASDAFEDYTEETCGSMFG
ncbi:MAG TPA: DUF2510 domain-containing protein [Nocardioides sp.]